MTLRESLRTEGGRRHPEADQVTAYNPGDEVVFFGTRYTLIERTGMFGWLAVATDDPHAKPRVILDEYLKAAPTR